MIKKIIKKSFTWAFAITSAIFAFVPETLFRELFLKNFTDNLNIIINRIVLFIIILFGVIIIRIIYLKLRKKVIIKGHNYRIDIKYGDIFEEKECKRVIPFDECFTNTVGERPSDIKPNSICGKYLETHPNLNIELIIKNAGLHPEKKKSRFNNQECYMSGKIAPNGDDLLLAFVKLNKDGLGEFTYKEFCDCLSILWKELDKYSCQKDVCIPILGSSTNTRIGGKNYTQQEILEIILHSYMLSEYKIRKPNKLRIICYKSDEFSLNNISL